MNLNVPMQMEGWIKCDARGPDGELRRSTGWFHNLVLNSGLNGIGSGVMVSSCYVGTGSTTPTAGDAALAAYLAQNNVVRSITPGAATSSPYYVKNTWVFRFNAGVATGNVSEIGIAATGTPPQPLFSRALVLDGGGSPTTITVLSDEILDVTYEIRAYAPTSDWTGTISIGGDSYDVTVRPANVTTVPSSGVGPGYEVLISGDAFAYTGAIGAVTGGPSGTQVSRVTGSNNAYSSNSYQRDMAWTFPVDDAGDIESVLWRTSYGDFQIGFSPAIHKTNTQTLAMVARIAWARKDLG
jgi:hypothetical protein